MYNRYIPEQTDYIPVEPEPAPPPPSETGQTAPKGTRLPPIFSGGEGLSGLLTGKKGGLSGLLKNLKLGDFDSGDILLLLIVLFLLTEGDDLELVIALGLALIMGLGEEGGPQSKT